MYFYILLGLAARGHDFRNDRWPVPDGAISWVRYVDPENPEPPLQSWSSEQPPPFGTDPAADAYLDFAPQAGRLMLTIEALADEVDADETAWAIADAMSGLSALASPALGMEVHIGKISGDAAANGIVTRAEVEDGVDP